MTALTEHKTFDSAEVETGKDAGSFTALVSTWEPDRQGEVVKRGAFRRSLARWRKSGRTIPLLADHDGTIGAVVGRVDPRVVFETEKGLEASGTFDFATELGRRTYELVKSGALSWSIGFVVPKGGRRRDGELTELVEIDLAEISAVPVPANEGARTLSIKSHRPAELVSFEVA